MRYVNPKNLRRAISWYLVLSVVVYLSYQASSAVVFMYSVSKRSADKTFMAIFFVCVAGVAALGIWYPRFIINFAGGLLVTAALTLAVIYPTGYGLIGGYGTIQFVQLWAPGLIAVNLMTYILTRPWRRIRPPDVAEPRCAKCGYPRRHLTTCRCPECGSTEMHDPAKWWHT